VTGALLASATRLSVQEAGSRRVDIGSSPSARSALGHCRSGWQGRPHSDGFRSRLGEKRTERLARRIGCRILEPGTGRYRQFICHLGPRCARVTKNMRRFIASFVLSVVAWSLVAPVAWGVTGTATPACCRRNGKHHCTSGTSGIAGMSADDLPSFRVNSSDCPHRSQLATPTGIAQPQSHAVSALQPPSASFVSGADSRCFNSRLATCNSQRGPPAFRL
jgi:hypothetical protein